MVVIAGLPSEQISITKPQKTTHADFSGIPAIDLSSPGCGAAIVRGYNQEFGFFKETNHGISKDLMARPEAPSIKFASPGIKFFFPGELEKEKEKEKEKEEVASTGNKRTGLIGVVGWVEYLPFKINNSPTSSTSHAFLIEEPSPSQGRSALNEYSATVRSLDKEVLGLMAQGLGLKGRDAFSRPVMSQDSDLVFGLNLYPQVKKDAKRTATIKQINDPTRLRCRIAYGPGGSIPLIAVKARAWKFISMMIAFPAFVLGKMACSSKLRYVLLLSVIYIGSIITVGGITECGAPLGSAPVGISLSPPPILSTTCTVSGRTKLEIIESILVSIAAIVTILTGVFSVMPWLWKKCGDILTGVFSVLPWLWKKFGDRWIWPKRRQPGPTAPPHPPAGRLPLWAPTPSLGLGSTKREHVEPEGSEQHHEKEL